MSAPSALETQQPPDMRAASDLLTEVEERLAQLKLWQRDNEVHCASLGEQTRMLGQREAELNDRQRSLAEQQNQLDSGRQALLDQQTALESTRAEVQGLAQELAEQREGLKQQKQEMDEALRRFEDARAELGRAGATLEADKTALGERRRALEAQRVELERKAQEFEGLHQQYQTERTALEETRQRLAAQERELEGKCDEIDGRHAQYETQRAELELQWRELQAERERLRDERAELTKLREQIEAQQGKLDEARRPLEDELTARSAAQEELDRQWAAIDKAREELDARQRVLEQTLAALSARTSAPAVSSDAAADGPERGGELDAERERLETRKAELDAEYHDLHAERASLEAQWAQLDAGRHELDAQRGRFEIKQKEHASLAKALESHKAQLEQSKAQLERAKTELAQQATQSTLSGDQAIELARKRGELEARELELEQKQAAFRETLQRSRDQLVAEREHLKLKEKSVDEKADKLAARADLIKKADGAVMARRAKLHKYRKLLRNRSRAIKTAHDGAASTQQQYAGLLQQRQVLLDVRRFLASSEAEMVRRWSTSRAATLVVGAVLATVFLAMFSYALGNKVVQPVWLATTALEITVPTPDGQTGPTAADWLAEQRKVLISEEILKEAIAQLDQRGVRLFDSPAAMRDRLGPDLRIDALGVGKLTMEYRSTDGENAVFILESLGRAYLGFQMVEDRKANRPNSTKIVRLAARDPKPVKDERLMVSGAVFGGSMLTAIVLVLLIRSWLRAARVLDGQEHAVLAQLENADAWPELPKVPAGKAKS